MRVQHGRSAMFAKISFVAIATLALTACNVDGITDKSPEERAYREALCIVSSEHFALYPEAEKHLKHGLEAARTHFDSTGTALDFYKILSTTRQKLPNFSNGYYHSTLANRCGRKLTNGEYKNAR